MAEVSGIPENSILNQTDATIEKVGETNTKLPDREIIVSSLSRLTRTKVHLPLIDQPPIPKDKEKELDTWINSLTDQQLVEEIKKQNERIQRDVRNQDPQRRPGPPGMARP